MYIFGDVFSFYTTMMGPGKFDFVKDIWKEICEEHGKYPENYELNIINEFNDAVFSMGTLTKFVQKSIELYDIIVAIPEMPIGEVIPVHDDGDVVIAPIVKISIPHRSLLMQYALVGGRRPWFDKCMRIVLKLIMGYIIVQEKQVIIRIKNRFTNPGGNPSLDLGKYTAKGPADYFQNILRIHHESDVVRDVLKTAKLGLEDLALLHGISLYNLFTFHELGISSYWTYDEFMIELFGEGGNGNEN